MGRRERKKAVTRKAISDAATELFLERGFDQVSIREIAEKADVSPTTVFAHFPQKEALVFDEDEEQRERLVTVVRSRPPGTSITAALRAFYAAEIATNAAEHGDGVTRRFMEFLDATPALRDYAAKMWLRHEDSLAATIAEEFGLPEPNDEIRAYARFVLQIQLLVTDSSDPLSVLDAGFRVLDDGWAETARRITAESGRWRWRRPVQGQAASDRTEPTKD